MIHSEPGKIHPSSKVFSVRSAELNHPTKPRRRRCLTPRRPAKQLIYFHSIRTVVPFPPKRGYKARFPAAERKVRCKIKIAVISLISSPQSSLLSVNSLEILSWLIFPFQIDYSFKNAYSVKSKKPCSLGKNRGKRRKMFDETGTDG